MFLIKFILVAAILLVVLLIGVEFSTLNADPVTIKYLLGATTIPLHKPLAEAISAGDEHRAAELTGQILDIVEVEVRQEMEGGDA